MGKRIVAERPRRGEVYLVNFDPTVGAEIRKTRLAVIIQNDVGNRFSPITMVAAITSKFEHPLYPVEVLIRPPEGGLQIESVATLNQIRSLDRRRLIKRLGEVRKHTLDQIDNPSGQPWARQGVAADV